MTKLTDMLYFKGMELKMAAGRMLKDERGETNIIAIILILAIVIALAIFFRGAIKELFNTIWADITTDVNNATGNY